MPRLRADARSSPPSVGGAGVLPVLAPASVPGKTRSDPRLSASRSFLVRSASCFSSPARSLSLFDPAQAFLSHRVLARFSRSGARGRRGKDGQDARPPHGRGGAPGVSPQTRHGCHLPATLRVHAAACRRRCSSDCARACGLDVHALRRRRRRRSLRSFRRRRSALPGRHT